MDPDQSERLGRRIRVLDRARRPVSVMFGIAVAAIVMAQFDDSGSALANYGVALGGALGLVTWVVIELVIGIALAVFETQQRQLSSTRGLPHATVIRK